MRGVACGLICLFGLWGTALAGGERDLFGVEREMAAALEARAQALLDGTLGPGRARVFVRVELDASRVEEVRAVAAPGGLRAHRLLEANVASGSRTAEAAVRAVSRSVSRTLRPGGIRRISAVLVVNADARPEGLLPAVKGAVGFSQVRGDRLVVRAR